MVDIVGLKQLLIDNGFFEREELETLVSFS